jgi:hypothetical protein
MQDVHLWMIDQHLGRRSVSDFQRGVLALRKREIVAERRAAALAASSPSQTPAGHAAHNEHDATSNAEPSAPVTQQPPTDPLSSREAIARAARLSSSQVVMIEKIRKQAAPEVVAAVKSGTISINAAAAVASLPAEEQVAIMGSALHSHWPMLMPSASRPRWASGSRKYSAHEAETRHSPPGRRRHLAGGALARIQPQQHEQQQAFQQNW